MLSTTDLSKKYRSKAALTGVSLSIEPGEILGLVGPNGAGKTTFISIVAGLLRPDAGNVVIDGIDALRHPKRAAARVGVATQEIGIYPILSVRENLKFFGKLAGVRGAALEASVRELADAFQLVDVLGARAGELSGGQRRRLHAATALMGRPRLILVDEPTAGVDVATRERLLEVVRGLARAGTAVCYTTHYLQEIESLNSNVAIIDEGRIIARGSVTDLVRDHAEPVVVFTFRGLAPRSLQSGANHRIASDGRVVRVHTSDPTKAISHLTGSLDPSFEVESIEILKPSLETVFLSLTGRRYEGEGDEATKES